MSNYYHPHPEWEKSERWRSFGEFLFFVSCEELVENKDAKIRVIDSAALGQLAEIYVRKVLPNPMTYLWFVKMNFGIPDEIKNPFVRERSAEEIAASAERKRIAKSELKYRHIGIKIVDLNDTILDDIAAIYDDLCKGSGRWRDFGPEQKLVKVKEDLKHGNCVEWVLGSAFADDSKIQAYRHKAKDSDDEVLLFTFDPNQSLDPSEDELERMTCWEFDRRVSDYLEEKKLDTEIK